METSRANLPLAGKTIIVTRPENQSKELGGMLRRLGAYVVAAPAIRIAAPTSWIPLDRSLRQLRDHDAVIFTSANGVAQFFNRARKVLRHKPARPKRVYAIGPGTAKSLRSRGWNGAQVPEKYEGEALARFLGSVRGWSILIPRARVARDVLPEMLRARGARVNVVEAYRTLPDRAGLAKFRRALCFEKADFVTFTSSSTVEHSISFLGRQRAKECFKDVIAASIGPVTSTTLKRHGIRRILQAKVYTTQGLVQALTRHARHQNA